MRKVKGRKGLGRKKENQSFHGTPLTSFDPSRQDFFDSLDDLSLSDSKSIFTYFTPARFRQDTPFTKNTPQGQASTPLRSLEGCSS